MKLWCSYGSEHSMNLVLIGRFRTPRDADEAHRLIEALSRQASKEELSFTWDSSPQDLRFSDDMRAIFEAEGVYIFGPQELEQFNYEITTHCDGDKLLLRTDETDVSAFIKVMLHKGARVEIYSAHNYPDEPRAL